jgi:hypothetical protein
MSDPLVDRFGHYRDTPEHTAQRVVDLGPLATMEDYAKAGLTDRDIRRLAVTVISAAARKGQRHDHHC